MALGSSNTGTYTDLVPYHITLNFANGMASLSVNGTQVLSNISYTPASMGRLYIGTTVPSNGGEAFFDNINVHTLSSPTAPTLSSITPNPSTTGNIPLSWSSSTGATSYNVYRSINYITTINGTVTLIGSPTGTTINDNGLINGTYYYTVTAVNSSGPSNLSNCQNIVVSIPTYPPTAPILNAITPNSSTSGNIALNWNSVAGATSYTIYRSSQYITSINGSVSSIGTQTAINFNDTGLSNGTYYYAITAGNSSGSSVISNCQSVVVSIPSSVPAAPILNVISPNPSTTGNISLSWTSVTSATLYRIYRSTSNITVIDGSTSMQGSSTGTGWNVNGLTNGTYYFAITALNGSGSSAPSNCQSVNVTINIPPSPTFTNGTWILVQMGITNLNLTGANQKTYLTCAISTTDSIYIRMTYYTTCPTSPVLANGIGYWSIEINNTYSATIQIGLMFYYSDFGLSTVQEAGMTLYSLQANNWSKPTQSLSTDQNTIVATYNSVQYYGIRVDSSPNDTLTNPSFNIPGYPIGIFFALGILSILVCAKRIRKLQ
jgi:fibronectin type 3 domain-containing protein